MYRPAWVEIDLEAIRDNIRAIKKRYRIECAHLS